MLEDLKKGIENEKTRVASLFRLLDISGKEKLIADLHQKTSSSDLWSDPKAAQKILQELKNTETQVKAYDSLRGQAEDISVLIDTAIEEGLESEEAELAKDISALREKISGLELSTLLGGEYDANNAILTINAGTGGTDAQDWAEILMRMYSRWAESKGYSVQIADISYGEEAGIKGATLFINGQYAYGYLKTEKGIHRLVRMSPFNADAKTPDLFRCCRGHTRGQ